MSDHHHQYTHTHTHKHLHKNYKTFLALVDNLGSLLLLFSSAVHNLDYVQYSTIHMEAIMYCTYVHIILVIGCVCVKYCISKGFT